MQTNNGPEIGPLVVQLTQIITDILILVFQIVLSVGLSIVGIFLPKQPKSVKGEKVLVTGAGHGIGKELALLYASQGATVIVWDLNEETANQTVQEIANSGLPKAHAFKCDVSNRDDVQRAAQLVQNNVGDVTILINNAGIAPTHSFLDHTKEEIERIININVLGHFWTLEAFLPAMKRNNYGHIISLSSSVGLLGTSNLVPYSCSKFAVRGLMEALFQELREDKKNEIKLTSIYPFMVNTGMCKKPYIRFENLMPMLEPKYVAKEIMNAQRKDLSEISIPRYIFYLNLFGRLLPQRAQLLLKDFMHIGLHSDLN